jgi:hypothetical protein
MLVLKHALNDALQCSCCDPLLCMKHCAYNTVIPVKARKTGVTMQRFVLVVLCSP